VDKTFHVYILASRSKNLYTGVTNDLFRRVKEHKRGLVPGFTSRYRICRLVHVEEFRYIRDAIAREKQIKAWTRAKRIALIEEKNPGWYDLAKEWWGNDERNADSSLDARRIRSE
jgi:putative endonuclease